jgi:predicted PurR-regulated permease PerM
MVQTVLTVAVVAILIAALWAAREALLLVYVSALIAMGFSPLVQWLEQGPGRGRTRVPRWFAILVIYLVVILVVVMLGVAVIPRLISQAAALWAKMPDEFEKVQTQLMHYRLLERRVTLAEAVQNAPSGTSAAAAVGTVIGALSSFAGGLFGIVTVLILSFYFLVEARSMFDYLVRLLPEGRRGEAARAARDSVVKVSAWLGAQVVLAGVMGTAAAIGLGYLEVPYFYVIALVAAIGEMIPFIGPIIAGLTAVAVALTVSLKLALTAGTYFLVLHQLESNILVPKIMERRVGVSPVAVMIALLIGGALWGIIGAILAIPTVAIISVIIEDLAHQET